MVQKKQERLKRTILFVLLALFSILLAGSAHQERKAVKAPLPRAAAGIISELPSAQRAEWQKIAEQNPALLLEICSR